MEGIPWFRGFRDGQAETVSEILEAFARGTQLVILDAPTGSGKTLIAEAVRQNMNAKGVYLCTSKTLQDQFARDFTAAKVLKGRRNYLPIDRHVDRWGNGATCEDCNYTKDTGCSYCPNYNACPYVMAKRAMVAAELACTNTSYFMTECGSARSQVSGAFALSVLDEADLAENEIMRHVSVSISPAMQKRLKLYPPRYKTKAPAWEDWLHESVPKVERWVELAPKSTLAEQRTRTAVDRMGQKLTAVAREPEGWVYTGYERGFIEFKPVMVNHLAEEYLWRHAGRWLAMSATMISPEEFIDSTGFEGSYEVVEMASPFAAEKRPVYYTPVASMTNAKKESSWPKIARALEAIFVSHPDERILVHTHSYALTQFLVNNVVMTTHRLHYYLSAEDRQAAISSFEDDDRGILLASSLDRGYDGKDDLVRVQVICKVPFPYLGDKQVSARLYSTKGGRVWYAVQTARSLVQMIGRGMRHKDDRCTTYILDEQFARFWSQWKKLLDHHLGRIIVWGGEKRKEMADAVG